MYNVVDKSKIDKINIGIKMIKSKIKNLIILFWVKFKLLAKNSKLYFFILKAKLAFNKLREAFIKVSIIYYVNLKY